jgi:hypothetical protein
MISEAKSGARRLAQANTLRCDDERAREQAAGAIEATLAQAGAWLNAADD